MTQTATATKVSSFEAAARTAKASKMASVLIAHGANPETAADLPMKGRMVTAELAGTRAPSETTWALVVEMVQAEALWGSMFMVKALVEPARN